MCWECLVYPATYWQILFFVARQLGSNGLTALNLAIPIYSFIHGSGLMIGMGGVPDILSGKVRERIMRQTRFSPMQYI